MPSLAESLQRLAAYRGLEKIKTDRDNAGRIYCWKFSPSFVNTFMMQETLLISSEMMCKGNDRIAHYCTGKAYRAYWGKAAADLFMLGQTCKEIHIALSQSHPQNNRGGLRK